MARRDVPVKQSVVRSKAASTDEELDPRRNLSRDRQVILRRLVELASEDRRPAAAVKFRERAERLIELLKKTDAALAGISVTSGYVQCNRGIDAVLKWLDDNGVAAPAEIIARGIAAGGWRGGTARSVDLIKKSIGIHLRGRGRMKNKIRTVDDRVGRFSWPDEMFR